MTFPSPSHSAKSSIASGADKPSSRPARSQQSPWGTAASQNPIRRGLTPLATNLSSSSTTGSPSRRPPQTHSPAPSTSATSPLTSSFSAVLSSTSRFPVGRNNPSPAPTSASFAAFQTGGQQQQSAQSLASPKFRALTPSSASHLATSAASTAGGGGSGGGGGGGGGGTGVSRGATFSPLLTGVNSPTGFASDKPNSASASAGPGISSSQPTLSKISVAQVFLLLDSINEKEGKEKWETKTAQIHKVSASAILLHHKTN